MTAAQQAPEWLAVAIFDHHITLWVMSESQVLQQQNWTRLDWKRRERSVKDGQQRNYPDHKDDLRSTLLPLLQDYLAQNNLPQGTPVLVSGSSIAKPALVPAKPADLRPLSLDLEGWKLQLLPGLMQKTPAAILQGAETQISGFLALNPEWDGVICLPGATTHWVQVSAAEVVSFQSFLTPKLFQVLCQDGTQNWSHSALCDAAADTMSKPERLAARLAELAAHAHMNNKDDAELNGLLWGYLIGAELAAARPYWLGQNLALIGADDFAGPYAATLEAQGLPTTRAEENRMALAGLTQSWRAHNCASNLT